MKIYNMIIDIKESVDIRYRESEWDNTEII
jgi:hypothetical protein